MARTLLLVSLFVGTSSLFLGCTQDFNVFKPGQGGNGGQSATVTTVTVVSSSASTGAGGAPQCTIVGTDPACDDQNICTTDTCDGTKCMHANVVDGLAPGYVDTPTDCVDDVCKMGVFTHNAPDDTEIPDDMNSCTADTCAGGMPVHTPTNSGMMCGTNPPPQLCDSMGNCVGCVVAGDCAGTDTFCKVRTCSALHVCGTMNQNEGMPTPTGQTTGDCKSVNCVNGTATAQADNNDKPVDGNVCTMDVCTMGVPSNPPELNTKACGTGASCPTMSQQKLADHCDGAGACAAQTPTACTGEFKCTGTACNATCTTNAQCQTNFVCDTNAGSAKINTCVQCAQQSDCSALAATPVCDVGTVAALLDTCVECTASTTCASKRAPSAITCTSAGFPDKCACTTDADCFTGTAGNCDAATGACKCASDTDCAPETCNMATHVCM